MRKEMNDKNYLGYTQKSSSGKNLTGEENCEYLHKGISV